MENLITEAPLIGGVVIIVMSFLKYLNNRDKEMRKMAELFSERVGSLEGTVNSLRDTIKGLKAFLVNNPSNNPRPRRYKDGR